MAKSKIQCKRISYGLFIPADLAWGKRGVGKIIGPYATLTIDARLVEVRAAG